MSTTNVYPTSARGPVEHDVRQQIVTAAKEHFSRYGYEKTTVSDLAKAIGFSKAYIYKFFESKQVIGEMICSNCLMEMEAEIRQAVASTDAPPEQLRRLFKAIVAATLRLFSEDRKPMRNACISCCCRCSTPGASGAISSARRRWMKPGAPSSWSCSPI